MIKMVRSNWQEIFFTAQTCSFCVVQVGPSIGKKLYLAAIISYKTLESVVLPNKAFIYLRNSLQTVKLPKVRENIFWFLKLCYITRADKSHLDWNEQISVRNDRFRRIKI